MTLDLLFPAVGEAVPTDHRYPLFAALSAVVPDFHAAGGPRFAALTGTPAGRGELRLTDRSRLRVRVAADQLRTALPLAGRRLDVAGRPVRLGVPAVVPVEPAAAVWSPLVTFSYGRTSTKRRASPRPTSPGGTDPDRFLTTARAK